MNINEIIKEELNNFLNEGVIDNDDNFTFTQLIEPAKLTFNNFQYFTDDFDINFIDATITIIWKVGFWVNDNGIENFMVNVESVDGTFKMELRDKRSDEMVRNEEKNIGETEWKFIVEKDVPLTIGGSYYVDRLDFDFSNNTCTVSFG